MGAQLTDFAGRRLVVGTFGGTIHHLVVSDADHSPAGRVVRHVSDAITRRRAR